MVLCDDTDVHPPDVLFNYRPALSHAFYFSTHPYFIFPSPSFPILHDNNRPSDYAGLVKFQTTETLDDATDF
ncbi:hypothetical protein RSOLAG1IB_11754 [Rhizoctonia solani AG-1 IB]|uniref:Uncharacterized protein n=1 Tax=Thanatephorus cucumeris (strain AG1-IB / isolate 7/3/14) TaxID=1108050 RepID=A0A0B7FEQ0_THACB|nr:hypothetical protein RSOLAG1IB_11754 [Rhizoctonia solani AG-1 IB]